MSPFVGSNILAGAAGQGGSGYTIQRSLRFNSGDSAHLSKTFSSAGNRKTWTWSGWVKQSVEGPAAGKRVFRAVSGGTEAGITFINKKIELYGFTGNSYVWQLNTTALFRDFSAWMHVVVVLDTTQATASNRVKLYVNGAEQTSFSPATYPSQNYEGFVNTANLHSIGGNNNFFDGYLADVHFIDGQALAPTDFGEYDDNNNWNPKAYTFTTNPNNGTTWSSTTNGNFWTAISRGADKAFNGSVNGTDYAQATTGNTATVSGLGITGITSIRVNIAKNSSSDNWGTFALDSTDITSWLQSNYASVGNSGTWIDVTSQFTSTTLGSISVTTNSSSVDVRLAGVEINGYVLLDGADDNSFHLDFSDNSSNAALGYDQTETVSLNPKGGMDVVTYTGNGSSQEISGLAFQPDFVWIKNRDDTDEHMLFNVISGPLYRLNSSVTNSEASQSNTLTAFGSNGFTLGSDGQVNQSSQDYVAWCWKAGGTASSNTDGTITSSVSVNTTYGFSIVTYTGNSTSGATVGHGLSTAPSFWTLKSRSTTGDWITRHTSIANTHYLKLNSTDAAVNPISDVTGDADPTSTVIPVGDSDSNNNNVTYVGYVWSEVSGFSKFGSYTGNGSSTGPTVTTGFKPRFLLIKNTNNTDGWSMWDSARNPSNPVTLKLEPNSNGVEGSNSVHEVNFLNDGFQILGTWNGFNGNGNTMIYAAFADRPGNNWDVNNLIVSDGTIAAASGALPILNTTGDYGKEVGTGTRTDSDNNFIVLALPMNGSNNGTTFTDQHATIKGSGTAKTVTVNGNTKTSTAQSIFYGSSGSFDGTDDNLKLPASADFQFGSGDFTIETWFRPNNTNRMAIYHGSSGTDHTLGIDYSYITQTIGIWASSTGTSWDLADGDSSGNRGSIVVPANAWTHIAFVRNGDLLQLYVGGALDKQFSITGSIVDASSYQPIIGEWWNNIYDLNGYLADFRIYKGIGKYTSNFNPPNLENASETDSLLDTPTNYDDGTNVGGNYATLNPLDNPHSIVLSNGNLDWEIAGTTFRSMRGNFMMSSGKWYFESRWDTGAPMMGIARLSDGLSSHLGSASNRGIGSASNSTYKDGSANTSGVPSHSTGDILMCAFDADAGKVWFGVNGSFYNSGDPAAGTNERYSGLTDGTWMPAVTAYNSSGSPASINFGQRPFAYTPPTGFLPLVTTSLPDPTIADGSTAFDAKLYSDAPSSVSGYSFSPDLIWLKRRSQSADHGLYDIVRGANKLLYPSVTNSEETAAGVSAFNSDGFDLGSNALFRGSGHTFVAWAWDAGSSNTSISAGGLNSSVYDQSQNWSALGTNDQSAPYNWEATFDGNSSTYGAIPPNGQAALVDFSGLYGGGIGYTSSVVITYNRNSSAPDVTVNGSAIGATANGTDRTYTLSGSGTLTSVGTQTRTVAGSGDCGIKRIVVDGKELVDSTATPPNVPSIASTVRANPSAGFSIVSYTATGANASVGHGLNAAPEFIIVKSRTNPYSWIAWHNSFGTAGNTDYLFFDSTTSKGGAGSYNFWNNTVPTNSVIHIGTQVSVNNNTAEYIAYCFAPVEGFSAFGSYTGNGSSDGPFVYTGFRPKFILIKNADIGSTGYDWYIYDTERDTYNTSDTYLMPNLSTAELSYAAFDFLSNGFKLRQPGASVNGNASTHVFACFAEHPFKTARAR